MADIFSGAGGIAEGFRQAGYSVVAGVDVDPDATATFALNFPEAETITGDMRARPVREHVIAAARGADVIAGGPPCQAFSQVRNHVRVIDDPRNSLYREFVRVVGEVRPPAFLMENVTGIDEMGVREQITADLSLEGEYRVSPQVVDAADFGVPQTRRRLLFVAVHRSLGCAPPQLAGSGATSSVALVRFTGARRSRYQVEVQRDLLTQWLSQALADPEDLRVVTVADAISDLAGLPVGRRDDVIEYDELPEAQSAYQKMMRREGERVSNVQVPRVNDDTVLRLAKIPCGGNYRDLPEDLHGRYLTGQRWGQDNGTGRLSRRHFYAYRRLHPGIWAWTLNTKADSAYHYRVARALSVREFARLQSFPDRFTFTSDPRRGALPGRIEGGPAHSRYRQAGNAVPPLLAAAAARALAAALSSAPGFARRTA